MLNYLRRVWVPSIFVAVLLFTSLAASAQSRRPPPSPAAAFSVYKSTALTAAAEVITVQKPTTTARWAHLDSAYLFSTVATTFTLELNGTAATTTTLTPTALTTATTVMTAFSASNVGTGTVIGTYDVAANGSLTLDLDKIWIQGAAAASNFTVRTNSITGTVRIVVVWEEQ